MLGEEQWKWLEQEVSSKDEAPALTLVVSSVQVLTTNPSMEGWGHFPAERDRLIRLLAGLAESTSVFLLSGDVHHGEILDPMRLKEDSFLEITSSGLTHDCSKGIYGMLCKPLLEVFRHHRYNNPHKYVKMCCHCMSTTPLRARQVVVFFTNPLTRHLSCFLALFFAMFLRYSYYIGKNYGSVNIDWSKQSVEIRLHDTSGRPVLSTGPQTLRTPHSAWTEQDILLVHPCMDGHLFVWLKTFLAVVVVTTVVFGLTHNRGP